MHTDRPGQRLRPLGQQSDHPLPEPRIQPAEDHAPSAQFGQGPSLGPARAKQVVAEEILHGDLAQHPGCASRNQPRPDETLQTI